MKKIKCNNFIKYEKESGEVLCEMILENGHILFHSSTKKKRYFMDVLINVDLFESINAYLKKFMPYREEVSKEKIL